MPQPVQSDVVGVSFEHNGSVIANLICRGLSRTPEYICGQRLTLDASAQASALAPLLQQEALSMVFAGPYPEKGGPPTVITFRNVLLGLTEKSQVGPIRAFARAGERAPLSIGPLVAWQVEKAGELALNSTTPVIGYDTCLLFHDRSCRPISRQSVCE